MLFLSIWARLCHGKGVWCCGALNGLQSCLCGQAMFQQVDKGHCMLVVEEWSHMCFRGVLHV